MEEQDARELTRLLGIVSQEQGHLPTQDAFEAIHKVVPWSAVEVLIIDPDDPQKYLLSWRDDSYWHGWHIPGGYVRKTHRSLFHACESVAAAELGNEFTLTSTRLVTAFLWDDHPYGSPISLVYACEVTRRPPVNDQNKFFSKLPSPIVPHHADFVEAYLNTLRP